MSQELLDLIMSISILKRAACETATTKGRTLIGSDDLGCMAVLHKSTRMSVSALF